MNFVVSQQTNKAFFLILTDSRNSQLHLSTNIFFVLGRNKVEISKQFRGNNEFLSKIKKVGTERTVKII